MATGSRRHQRAGAHALQAVDDDALAGVRPLVTMRRPSATAPSVTSR